MTFDFRSHLRQMQNETIQLDSPIKREEERGGLFSRIWQGPHMSRTVAQQSFNFGLDPNGSNQNTSFVSRAITLEGSPEVNVRGKTAPKKFPSVAESSESPDSETLRDFIIENSTESSSSNALNHTNLTLCTDCMLTKASFFFSKGTGFDLDHRCIQCRAPDEIVKSIKDKTNIQVLEVTSHEYLVDAVAWYFRQWENVMARDFKFNIKNADFQQLVIGATDRIVNEGKADQFFETSSAHNDLNQIVESADQSSSIQFDPVQPVQPVLPSPPLTSPARPKSPIPETQPPKAPTALIKPMETQIPPAIQVEETKPFISSTTDVEMPLDDWETCFSDYTTSVLQEINAVKTRANEHVNSIREAGLQIEKYRQEIRTLQEMLDHHSERLNALKQQIKAKTNVGLGSSG